MNIRIYTMTHKKFTPPSDPIYLPLQLGKAAKDDLGYMGDDTGDNISAQNCYFAELSGVYWVYKNVKDADIVGICHYRRYLIDDEEKLLTADKIEKLLIDNDMIATRLLTLRCNYYDGFAENHNISDLLAAEAAVKKLYPEYYEDFHRIIHDRHTYFGNIMICRKSLYDAYCKWLFDILFEVQRNVDIDSYDDYQKRLFGFISEILLYVYCRHNHLKVSELKVGMIGEKRETIEMKAELSKYFRAHDFTAAHKYITDCLKKRPDVLMEASDVFGELKICMQIISTCEYEYDARGTTILDRVDSLPALLTLFKQVNKIAGRLIENKATKEDRRFLEENMISEEMLNIAVTITKAGM